MKRRNLLKNTYYHICNRSVLKIKIFKCEADYRFLMHKIAVLKNEYKMDIAIYCIMPNHLHFLLKNKKNEKYISKFMQRLQLSYSKYYIGKYDHSGHVFQGIYKLILINNKAHFDYVYKYILYNPVDANLVKNPEDWPYTWHNKLGG